MVRARLDMLDVDGTSVVRHIMPLIQCISGCEQLVRKSRPPRYPCFPSSNPLKLRPILPRTNLYIHLRPY